MRLVVRDSWQTPLTSPNSKVVMHHPFGSHWKILNSWHWRKGAHRLRHRRSSLNHMPKRRPLPPRAHILPQRLDCLLHLDPQLVIIQIIISPIIPVIPTTAALCPPIRNRQQRCYKRLFQIRKTEFLRDACNGDTELLGELDGWSVFQFFAPVGAVEDALGFIGEREEVFAVEAGGAAREARVEEVEMIGACYLRGKVSWGLLGGRKKMVEEGGG